jgi:hypothetical protein
LRLGCIFWSTEPKYPNHLKIQENIENLILMRRIAASKKNQLCNEKIKNKAKKEVDSRKTKV